LNLATRVAILFVCISVRARAETPLQEASNADTRGDYVTELQLVRPLAEQHNPIAETLLGFLYYHGRAGLPQDYAGAAKWFGRASDDGEIHGEAMLGTLYLNGQGVPRESLLNPHDYTNYPNAVTGAVLPPGIYTSYSIQIPANGVPPGFAPFVAR